MKKILFIISLFTIISCGKENPHNLELKKKYKLPEGYTIHQAKIQYNSKQEPVLFAILKNQSSSKYMLFSSKEEIDFDIKKITVSKKQGEFLLYGHNQNWDPIMLKGKADGSIERKTLPRLHYPILSPNGKDYILLDRNKREKLIKYNDKVVYKYHNYNSSYNPVFSPDGEKLFVFDNISLGNKSVIKIFDIFSDKVGSNYKSSYIPYSMPEGNSLTHLSLNFNPNNSYNIKYTYGYKGMGGIRGVLAENVLTSNKYNYTNNEEFKKLFREKSLLCIEGDGFSLRGKKIELPTIFSRFIPSNDYKNYLLIYSDQGVDINQPHRGRNIGKKNYDIKIATQNSTVLDETVEFGFGVHSRNFRYKMDFTLDNKPLVMFEKRPKDIRKKKYQYVVIDDKKYSNFINYRFINENQAKLNTYVLTDKNKQETLFVNHIPVNKSFNIIQDCSQNSNKELFILSNSNGSIFVSKIEIQKK